MQRYGPSRTAAQAALPLSNGTDSGADVISTQRRAKRGVGASPGFEQLSMDLDPIAITPAPRIPPPPVVVAPAAIEHSRQPFGQWLLAQKDHRRDWIANLAKGAGVDPAFPKRGDPDSVRARLQAMGADGDAFEAVDDAEREWARD